MTVSVGLNCYKTMRRRFMKKRKSAENAEAVKLAKKKKRHNDFLNMKRNWLLYVFVLPAFLWLAIFHYYPLYGLQIAFQDYKPGQAFGTSEWVGLKYFTQFFKSYWFPTVMKNTVSISLLSFVLSFPLPIILALMLNEVKNSKLKKTIQTITYAPHFISTVVLCAMVNLFLSPTSGVIGETVNSIREAMGLGSTNLLMSGKGFKWIYALSGVWQGTGWASVIYFAALSGVDMEQVEAATIDGANKLQRIWYINLPVLIPTIVIQLILNVGGLLGVGFEKVYLLQNDSIMGYSEVISTYVYRVGINGGKFSFGTAIGLFNNAINAALLIIVNKIVKRVDDDLSLF